MARRFQSFGYHSLRELEVETAIYMSHKKMIKIPSALVYLLRCAALSSKRKQPLWAKRKSTRAGLNRSDNPLPFSISAGCGNVS